MNSYVYCSIVFHELQYYITVDLFEIICCFGGSNVFLFLHLIVLSVHALVAIRNVKKVIFLMVLLKQLLDEEHFSIEKS